MKVNNVLITVYNEGCVETFLKSFSTIEKASNFLRMNYETCKKEFGAHLDVDEYEEQEDGVPYFSLESYTESFWVRGEIYILDVE